MSTPLTGDRRFRNEPVRLADLTVTAISIEGYEFSNCRILGPAVIFLNESTLTASSFDAPGLDAIFWEIPPERQVIVGAIEVVRCTFSNCSFAGVGIAGPPEMRAVLEQGFT